MSIVKKTFMIMFLLSFTSLSVFAQSVPSTFSGVVKKSSDGVVNISTTKLVTRQGPQFGQEEFFKYFFGGELPDMNQRQSPQNPQNQYKTSALGSGFVINMQGYIVTNNHVIADADEIIIKFTNGAEAEAVVVGADPLTDLALLKIDPRSKGVKLTPIVLGDSDKAEIGDWVVAIGNPLGLGGTVTAGIISAKDRVLGGGPYDNFMQTDAAINPGNSGGPLLNMDGEVVGVNTAIIQSAQGLGFAVPVNMLKDILDRLKQGRVSRGWLGVTLQELNENLAMSFGLPAETVGVLVADVIAGDPADKAGLKAGDIIVGIDSETVEESRELINMIGAKNPNETVRLTIIRDGDRMQLPVKLGERPMENAVAGGNKQPEAPKDAPVSVSSLSREEMKMLNISEGVKVTRVEPNSSVERSGLKPGDIVVWFNRKPVSTPQEFYKMYINVKDGDIIGLKVLTQTGARFIAFNK